MAGFRSRPGHGRSPLSRATLVASALLLAACERQGAEPEPAPADAAATGRGPPAANESGSSAPPAGERPVDAETLPYADVEAQLAYGYFAFPSDMVEPLPAILLVHDWWGLDDAMRAAANRLAAAGYIVLAVDLYGGKTAADAGTARAKTIEVVENPKAVAENLRQAIDFVAVAGAPAVAIVGWGFGGGFALNTALEHPERIDAVVVFYGQVPGNADHLATLDAPVLGLFGGADGSIPRESVEAFAAATNRLGRPADIEIYADAGQGFADARRRAYDPALAARAWQRMLEFLATHLVADPGTDESP